MFERLLLVLTLFLASCAHSKQVERFGVDYNVALETMSNEQALLNILRAREGMPAHFTSVNRFTGQINLQANTGISSQLRGGSLSNTSQAVNSLLTITNTDGPAANLTDSQTDTSLIASGVDVFTPQISGQIVSGTSFEVGTFDNQEFFQGYTSALPLSTVDTFLKQGFDDEIIFYLLVSQVEYFLSTSVPNYVDQEGDRVGGVENDPNSLADMELFKNFVQCHSLYTISTPNKIIAPISRFKSKLSDNKLDLSEILKIDGEIFDFENELISDPNKDATVNLSRVAKTPLSARFLVKENCKVGSKNNTFGPSPNLTFAGSGVANVALRDTAGIYRNTDAPVDVKITFRSPESVLRYLGYYLRAIDTHGEEKSELLLSDNKSLFSIEEGKKEGARLSTKFHGQNYSVVNDADSVRNMEIINIVQQVVNLQKSSTDVPLSIPVRTVP